MVKVLVGPLHVTPALVYVAVTTIVATTGLTVLFTALKEGILPVPLAGKPIEGVVFVQVYTAPRTPAKLTLGVF